MIDFEQVNLILECFQEFEKTFIEILNNHAPMKMKLVKANQAPYMTRAFRKVIIRRSELETKYFKLKTNDTLKAYKKTEKLLQQTLQERKEEFIGKFESVICC